FDLVSERCDVDDAAQFVCRAVRYSLAGLDDASLYQDTTEPFLRRGFGALCPDSHVAVVGLEVRAHDLYALARPHVHLGLSREGGVHDAGCTRECQPEDGAGCDLTLCDLEARATEDDGGAGDHQAALAE